MNSVAQLFVQQNSAYFYFSYFTQSTGKVYLSCAR